MEIVYAVVATLVFMFGRSTAPKPTVVVIEGSNVVRTEKLNPPIIVVNDGVTTQVRETKLSSTGPSRDEATYPWRVTQFGDLTVDCAKDCW